MCSNKQKKKKKEKKKKKKKCNRQTIVRLILKGIVFPILEAAEQKIRLSVFICSAGFVLLSLVCKARLFWISPKATNPKMLKVGRILVVAGYFLHDL